MYILLEEIDLNCEFNLFKIEDNYFFLYSEFAFEPQELQYSNTNCLVYFIIFRVFGHQKKKNRE